MFPAAQRQRQKPVEEPFLLRAADVGHMTREDAVQSCTVPDGGENLNVAPPSVPQNSCGRRPCFHCCLCAESFT